MHREVGDMSTGTVKWDVPHREVGGIVGDTVKWDEVS